MHLTDRENAVDKANFYVIFDRTINIHYTGKISAYLRIFVASFPYFNGTGSVYVCIRKLTE